MASKKKLICHYKEEVDTLISSEKSKQEVTGVLFLEATQQMCKINIEASSSSLNASCFRLGIWKHWSLIGGKTKEPKKKLSERSKVLEGSKWASFLGLRRFYFSSFNPSPTQHFTSCCLARKKQGTLSTKSSQFYCETSCTLKGSVRLVSKLLTQLSSNL